MLKPGFYKFEPVKFFNKCEKPRFAWFDNPEPDLIEFKAFSLNDIFYHGAKWSYADPSDPEFIEYINRDLIQVEKDLARLTYLKNNLLQLSKQINDSSNLSQYYSDSAEHQKI